MRILVTGSRGWTDREAIYRSLTHACEQYQLNFPPDEYGNTMPDPEKITVVHGDCPTGADAIATDWCVTNNFVPETHPPDWSRGRKAGPERNEYMVSLGADLCFAFIGPCTSPRCSKPGNHFSHGATGCADLAESAGIRTIRHRSRR